MCGIVGFVGKSKSVDYLLDGLYSLEYRGYDSAGVATIKNDRLNIVKTVGKVAKLEECLKAKESISSAIGIAHTRWATHGKPNDCNSHPHADCKKNIAVVHNGIIENFISLKESLISKGHKFLSETDTEVIAHLIEDNIKSTTPNDKEFINAVMQTIIQLKGSYAINVIHRAIPNMIVGIKVKAPLVVGINNDEQFFGSDTSAFAKWCNKVIYLDDYDIAVIKDGSKPTIYSGTDIMAKTPKLVEKKVNAERLNIKASDASKNGLKHFMLKEIREQSNTVKATIEAVLNNINKAFGITPKDLKGIKNIMLVGCGTAYHATMVAKYWLEEYTGIPTQAELASEYKYRKVAMPKDTLAIFISQSGETADTVAALEKAKASKFKTVSICNVYNSTLSRLSDFVFFTKCGPEISVASTKAFTAQLSALFSLSILIGKSVGYINDKKVAELLKSLEEIPAYIDNLLKNNEKNIEALAKKFYKQKSFIFLGRNVNYPVSLEGALKLKEISYLQAEGFAAGEIKHGPIALIEQGMPVLALFNYNEIFDKMVNACEEVMARGAEVIAITDKAGDEKLIKKIKYKIVLDNCKSELFPILSVVALQLFAYYVAKLNGREIDQPRNLAKSVTVE